MKSDYICIMMTEQDYLQMMASLEEQRIRVTASPEAAEAFLREAGVWDMLISGNGEDYVPYKEALEKNEPMWIPGKTRLKLKM